MNTLKRSFVALLVALVSLLSAPLIANADNGGGESDDDDNSVGAYVEETIVIGGDTIGGQETRTVSVPVECWWTPIDQETFLTLWAVVHSLPFFWVLQMFMPSEEYVQEKLEEAEDTPGSWYTANCTEDAEGEDYSTFFEACGDMEGCLALFYAWYADSEGEPPVVIQPEDLANAAYAQLQIPNPEVDQNPKVEGTDRTTFVKIPTAFWVTDPDAVGGEDGELTITASVPETGLWVEVSATTNGLSIASPAGSTVCTAAEAVTPWTPGMGEPACAVSFERASTQYPNGYPVTASAIWETSWEGGFGGSTDGGTLDPINTEATVTIPVAEVQAIVSD